MLTPEELSAIEARANDATEVQWIFDVPALLAHIREQAAEIDSLKIELHKAQIDCGLYKTEMFEQASEIEKYKPYYDAIMWLQERGGEMKHWIEWQLEAENYIWIADDFLEAFKSLKKQVEGETNE